MQSQVPLVDYETFMCVNFPPSSARELGSLLIRDKLFQFTQFSPQQEAMGEHSHQHYLYPSTNDFTIQDAGRTVTLTTVETTPAALVTAVTPYKATNFVYF